MYISYNSRYLRSLEPFLLKVVAVGPSFFAVGVVVFVVVVEQLVDEAVVAEVVVKFSSLAFEFGCFPVHTRQQNLSQIV